MLINSLKTISKPYLKTTNPLSKKWYVCFKYRNSQNEVKEYKKTEDLNKSPFVLDGAVNLKTNVVKQRLRYGQELVKVYESKLKTTEFDIATGTFVEDLEDKPLFEFLDNWLQYKSYKVTSSSLSRYKDKIKVLKDYLTTIGKENISVKNFNYSIVNTFLIHLQNKYSNSLHNYYLTLLGNIFKYLIRIEKLKIENVTQEIEKLKEDDTEKHAKYRDVNKAFEDLTNHHYYLGLMAKTIYYTLHRIDTITQLQFKDFDIVNGVINIPSSKIKTRKKLQIRISKHLLPIIKEYLQSHQPRPNDYWFGHTNPKAGYRKKSITMFGKYKSDVQSFSNLFHQFRNKKTTDKKLFTPQHTLYGMKANGYIYYKEYVDDNGNMVVVDDRVIIKLTGHSNTDILKKYSRDYEATISLDLWNRF